MKMWYWKIVFCVKCDKFTARSPITIRDVSNKNFRTMKITLEWFGGALSSTGEIHFPLPYLFQLMQVKEKKEGNEDEEYYMCFKLFLVRILYNCFWILKFIYFSRTTVVFSYIISMRSYLTSDYLAW